MSVTLDKQKFHERVDRFYSHLKKTKQFQNVDCLIVAVGKLPETEIYLKSTALQLYLLAYEFPELIIVFTDDELIFLMEILRQLEGNGSRKLSFLVKDNDNSTSFDYIWKAMKNTNQSTWGFIKKDEKQYSGLFYEEYLNSRKTVLETHPEIQSIDVSDPIGILLSVKEQSELIIMKRAASFSADVMQNHFRVDMEKIIEEEIKQSQTKLSEKLEEIICNPIKYGVQTRVNSEFIDSCYTPIILSYSKDETTDDILKFGVITCSLGSRYKNYCSNIARTYLVNPTKNTEAVYSLLYLIRQEVIKKLAIGIGLNELYATAIKVIEKSDYPQLVKCLGKSIGYGLGIEFKESLLSLTSKNMTVAQAGMVFNLSISLKDIETDNFKYSLLLSDVIVLNEGEAQMWTSHCESELSHISYTLDDNENERNDSISNQMVKDSPTTRSAVLESRTRQEEKIGIITEEEIRRKKQEDISKRLHEEAKARLIKLNNHKESNSFDPNRVTCYKRPQLLHEKSFKKTKIHVDSNSFSVIFPIYGQCVPFHISMIKNTSIDVHGEGTTTEFRINFQAPGVTVNKTNLIFNLAPPESAFIKELVYNSIQPHIFTEISQHIKELQNKFKQEEARRKELEGLVTQKDLILTKTLNYAKLNGLYVRPQFSRGRAIGVLEAHENGFRYISKNIKLDILYENIRYAFFQPSAHELIVLLHFHLKTPIMAPYTKKQSDIQFFTEAIESVQDLGSKTHSTFGDRDELEAEQRERRLKQQIDKAFKTFIEKVPEVTFEQPIRNLGFHGVPGRSNVLLMPTADCLVSLTEQPVFVLPLEDIEVAHFERITLSCKNFDLVLVNKDYKTWNRITAIETKSLDTVKDWLTQYGIKYFELRSSINWDTILKSISLDPSQFLEDGGWNNLEGTDTEEEEEEMEDVDYVPSGEESETDEETEYSDAESFVESDESTTGNESGDDWDELERKAEADDRKRFDSVSDEEEEE